MGGCISCSALLAESPHQLPSVTAKVVSINGTLREYIVPVFVHQVLEIEAASSSSSFFLCNSDFLSYDDYIPALDSKALLSANQLYFVLPTSKLRSKLSSTDMAALAVKASLALQNSSSSNKGSHHRNKKARISPVLLPNQSSFNHIDIDDYALVINDKKHKHKQQQQQQPSLRSASVRRLHKYSSRRAKLAVRSFKLRLTTIYEGTAVL